MTKSMRDAFMASDYAKKISSDRHLVTSYFGLHPGKLITMVVFLNFNATFF